MLYGVGKGRYQTEYDDLWNRLVPMMGQADTVQGELVRVIGKLAGEFYRNGIANWDRGFRMFTNFLYRHLRDPKVFDAATIHEIEADIAAIRDNGSRKRRLHYLYYAADDEEDVFDRLTDRVVEWCRYYPAPLPHTKNSRLIR